MKSPVRLLFFTLALATGFVTSGRVSASPIIDPPGDTFGTGPGFNDIVNSSGFVPLNATTIRLTVNFAGSVSAPSLFAPDSVVGYVDLDLDRDAGTGAAPFVNTYGMGSVLMGDEAYIDLFSELFNPGFVDLVDANTFAVLASLPITFGPTSFFIDLPLAAIGNQQPFNYALVVGTFNEPTDRAPNGQGPFVSAVPEPASLAVFGGVVVLGLVARRRRAAV